MIINIAYLSLGIKASEGKLLKLTLSVNQKKK